MGNIIFQPKGVGTARNEGGVHIQAPKATGWITSNFTLDGGVVEYSTGLFNAKYSGSFDDYRYYTGDTSS